MVARIRLKGRGRGWFPGADWHTVPSLSSCYLTVSPLPVSPHRAHPPPPCERQPDFFASSPHLLPEGTAPPPRKLFFYFNGALGLTAQFVNYSFGLRQQLYYIAKG